MVPSLSTSRDSEPFWCCTSASFVGPVTGSGANITSLNASELGSGTVPIARLGASGTKDATTFLRGDNTFAVVDSTSLKDAGGNTIAQAVDSLV